MSRRMAILLLGLLPTAAWAVPGSTDGGVGEVLRARAAADPFNVVATAIFALAVLHTFLTARFRHWSHIVEERHRARMTERPAGSAEVSFGGQMLHFLGEVEAVFGIWVVVLGGAMVAMKGVQPTVVYLGEKVNFNEAAFVVVIMALASARPVLQLAENGLRAIAALGGGRPFAWWLTILTVAPLLGAFITEPAAMTIAALLLSRQFYALEPSPRLRYATLGLLFVNISVGGTLTHFAAPPVLMVASAWGWGFQHMLTQFGGRAVLGILLSNLFYFLIHRRELMELRPRPTAEQEPVPPVPVWVTTVHLLFMAFTVAVAHYPALFVGGFLFYLAFGEATAHHQSRLELRGPLLVGFFLAGLVVHGGLQAWWIEPVLGRLGEMPLFLSATLLTAFNDNALITYLATLVPGLSPALQHAVVSGAVVGGGLTVIANAPNPAGQSLLQKHFPEGVSPLGLLLGALIPTLVMGAVFLFL